MSLTSVTDAIQAFMYGIDGISYIYQEMPWTLAGDEWLKNPENGTVAIIHIDDMTESRVTVPAVHGGQKAVDYTVRFLMLYQYKIPPDLAGATKDVWSVGLKSLVDATAQRIRSDPAFGCQDTGPIWRAGDAQNGVHTAFDMPVNIGPGTVACWTSTQFIVTEIIQA